MQYLSVKISSVATAFSFTEGSWKESSPSGQGLKAGSYIGEHNRGDRANRQAEADKRKRTSEEQTDKYRPVRHLLKTLLISNIRVSINSCVVELYSQLTGSAFPPNWEYIPNVLGTCSQLSGNIGRKRSCQILKHFVMYETSIFIAFYPVEY